jgi:hypothetical protein
MKPKADWAIDDGNRFGKLRVCLALFSFVIGTVTGLGDNLPISEPNFVDPALDGSAYTSNLFSPDTWTGGSTSTGSYGVADIAYFNSGYIPLGPDYGYINSSDTISQDLTTVDSDGTYLPNTIYTLSGYVGSPTSRGIGAGGSTAYVEILAGSTVLTDEALTDPGAGNWDTFSVSYTTGAVAPAGDIVILLGEENGSGQAEYTGISFTTDPAAAGVPDGTSTLSLLGISLIGLGALWRKLNLF